MVIRQARGTAEVDIGRPNANERGEQRKHQRGNGEKYRAIRHEIGDEARETGREHTSRRGEALIASKSFGERCVADQAKADGDDREAQEPAGDPLENQSGHHQRQRRPNGNDQCAGRNHSGTKGDRESLRADGIEQSTSWQLTQQSGEAGCRQYEADILLRPILLGQKCGHVRAEARQCAGEKQVDGVEAVQAGNGRRWFDRTGFFRGICSDHHCARLRLWLGKDTKSSADGHEPT
jgi:hypothetical protein